ncbi:MAG: hypothetical protein Q9163_003913 [Psora crenata]
MNSKGEQPSQAERLGAVADAGPGASDKNDMPGDPISEKPANGTANGVHTSGSTPSDPAISSGSEKANEEPQRSALKTIITTAAPTITAHFNASEADYTWIGSAYLLAAAASVPTWGKFSDIWGRKPILLVANFVFLIGSLIAALSSNVQILLAGRVLQGIGGGGLIILANICISDLFSMRERGKYFGMVGGVWGLASALGPVLGGVFTQKVSWRWCFYINRQSPPFKAWEASSPCLVPFDGLAFVIILFLLDIDVPKTPLIAGLKAIDWLGVVTISGGTVMFLLGLEYGGVSYPWSSATTLCLIVFGIVTIGLFFINEWKLAVYPVMPLRLFKHRSNVASLGVCFIHGMVFISGTYFLPLYFQTVLGATPILSGVYLFPFVLSLSFVSIIVGVFIKKTGQYLPPIWLGMMFMAIGFGLFIDLPNGRTWGRIFAFQIIAGIGVGPNFQAPLIALQTKVEPRDIATATALFGFTRNLATSISVVIGGVIFQNRMVAHQPTLEANLPRDVAIELSHQSAGASTQLVQHLPQAQRRIVTGAYTESLRTLWIFYVVMASLGVLVSFAISKQALSQKHQQYKGGLEAEQEHRRLQQSLDAQKKLEKEEKRRSRRSHEVGDAPPNGGASVPGPRSDEAAGPVRADEHTGGDHNV